MEQSKHSKQQMNSVSHSAISQYGNATNNDIQGDYVQGDKHIHQPAPRKPPLMLPSRAMPFVGRDQELTWLLQALNADDARCIAICGPGGIGKTALAAEALARLSTQENYATLFPDGIFYHSFYTYPSLEVAFEEIARIFSNDPAGDNNLAADPRRAAVRALSRRRALLVFDGVESLSDVQPLWDLAGTSTILILSRRHSDAPDRKHCYDLEQLPFAHSCEIIQQLGGERASDQGSLTHLVKLVGGLPLALRLTGSYLRYQEENIADYLLWFEREGLQALHQGDHPYQSVQVLLSRSVAALSPREQLTFTLLGLLAPAPFPAALMQAIQEKPQHTITQALGVLVNLSLLRRLDDCYEISHPLVHMFATNMLHACEPAEQQRWFTHLITASSTHFTDSDPYDPTMTLWLPHVAYTLTNNYPNQEPTLSLDMAQLLNRAGSVAYKQGKYQEAEPLLQRVLAIREQYLGPDHPDTATSLNNLAGLYSEQGRYPLAEPLYQRALAICEHHLGPAHPLTALSLNNLAELYLNQGRYPLAEPLLQRALAICEHHLGPAHPLTALSLNNLAGFYLNQGCYPLAEPLLQRVLAIREQYLGPDHPDTAQSLNNLAGLYYEQGHYPLAEPLFRRALTIYEQSLGPNHSDTAMSLNNLAQLYSQQGRYAPAEPLLQRALAIREQHLGPNHPDTTQSLNNLAELYLNQGRYPQAEPFLKRALSICEQHLGSCHPKTATSLNNLATLYANQGCYTQAEPLYQRALAINEQQLGSDHPTTAASLSNLAGLYSNQSRYALAEPLLKRALAICKQHLGPDHPTTANVRDNYAACLYAQESRHS